ncbi:MAG TPA: sulfate ABC transporter permease subunit CysT, partial [Fimbriimonas sp.]
MFRLKRHRSVIPGFGLTLGITLFYLSLIVLIPLSTMFVKTSALTWDRFLNIVTRPNVVSALKLSFGAAFAAACVNLVFGFLVAWVLARYAFPGKRIVDGLVDLPFALPTAVAGICLTTICAENGLIGRLFAPYGVKIAYTPIGVVVALVFIGIPFVVRTVQPVFEDMDADTEEAAASLGASRAQTFRRVIVPVVLPALLTGFALAFARAAGEYGSVVFISGNLPGKTEIAPLIIMSKLEQYDTPGATAVAVV